jgi:xylan 1,4-beta-xylosidase
LVVFYDDENFAYLRVYCSESLASTAVGVVLVRGGHKEELVLDRVPVASGDVVLHVRIRQGTLQFSWREPQADALRDIGPELDATFMSDEATRGFTGTMVGLACVDAYRRDLLAAFDYLDLRHGPAT